MVKRNDTPDAASLTKSPGSEKVPKKTSTQKRSSANILLFFLTMVALLLAVYALWQTKRLDTAFVPLQTQAIQAEATQSSVAQLNQKFTTNEEHLLALQRSVQSSLKEGFYQKEDWVALKARYYLELAQMNAYWSEESKSTIALLQQADSLLASLSDQRYIPVREAIAHDITQLEANPSPDLIGILTKLNALQATVKDLPINSFVEQPGAESSTSSNPPSASDSFAWRAELQKSLSFLKKLVVVHHDTDKTSPLLPKHRALLQDVLLLNLQEAQWAVLHRNKAVYQLVLQQARDLIKASFDTNSPFTQNLIRQLEELQQIPLSSSKSTVKEPLNLLNAIMDDPSMPLKPNTPTKSSAPAEDTP